LSQQTPNAFPISYYEPIKTTALPLHEPYSFFNFSDDSNESKLIISQSPDNISLTTIPSDSNSIISSNSVDSNEVQQRLTENDVSDSNSFSSPDNISLTTIPSDSISIISSNS
ncbi:12231_t:CDS:1, partial [Racocetra fulgida]